MTYYNIFLVLIILVALLLILIIMVQSPKGGGLSSTFGAGGSSIGGVQNTNNFLDKGTWTLATLMVILILLANFTIPRQGNSDSQIDETIENREMPQEEAIPELPTTAPAKDSTKMGE